MRRPNLWFLPRAFFPHGGHGCWPSTRPSLRPLVSREKDIAKLGRDAPRENGPMIIAGKHDTLRSIPGFNVQAGYFPDFFGNYSRWNIDLQPRYILLRLPSLCLKTTKRFVPGVVDYRQHISWSGFHRCDGALRGEHRAEHCPGDSIRRIYVGSSAIARYIMFKTQTQRRIYRMALRSWHSDPAGHRGLPCLVRRSGATTGSRDKRRASGRSDCCRVGADRRSSRRSKSLGRCSRGSPCSIAG